jgi:hypothetical protein
VRIKFIREDQIIELPSVKGLLIDKVGKRYQSMPGIVKQKFPWANVAVELDNGYKCFECVEDFILWSNSI